ncbi:VanZ family protein [Atopobacter phocae]|uniref:VanZ family protein n=1 Tax=Atopobacter phocae TaxID=136492 RepID=UPI000471A26B|nr:VanZ family protein [Atopobacter phocae]
MKINALRKSYLWGAITLFLMIAIFCSSQMGYQQQTIIPMFQRHSFLMNSIARLNFLSGIEFKYGTHLVQFKAATRVAAIEFVLRKLAHFFSFFMIAWSSYRSLSYQKLPHWYASIVALLLTIFYAGFDEMHQSLNPNRTAMIEDVILDSFGGLTAMLFLKFQEWQK